MQCDDRPADGNGEENICFLYTQAAIYERIGNMQGMQALMMTPVYSIAFHVMYRICCYHEQLMFLNCIYKQEGTCSSLFWQQGADPCTPVERRRGKRCDVHH